MHTEITSFDQLALDKSIQKALTQAGFTQPTPIQQKAIPTVLAGFDTLGIAQTGTGKTAAFVLPLLSRLQSTKPGAPRAVILSPTRELTAQIAEQVKLFSKYNGMRHLCVYGGAGMEPQIQSLRRGIDILIATPGRLIDLYGRRALRLNEIQILVLDEADRMMDMGFMPQIQRILDILPAKRQNLLFSATMPDKVLRLASDFLKTPVRVEVAPQSTPVDSVAQSLYYVPSAKAKMKLLANLLENEADYNRVMVFARTKHGADKIGKFLEQTIEGDVKVIHGDKRQTMRINAMNEFKSGRLRVLVATDVSSRGIDVNQISHVVNFDVPMVAEDYVHRIGRTGRAKHTGKAMTFCTEMERDLLRNIERLIRMKIPVEKVPFAFDPEDLQADPRPKGYPSQRSSGGYGGGGGRGRSSGGYGGGGGYGRSSEEKPRNRFEESKKPFWENPASEQPSRDSSSRPRFKDGFRGKRKPSTHRHA
jgi:ATP-dependent RNA helicase RhlE